MIAYELQEKLALNDLNKASFDQLQMALEVNNRYAEEYGVSGLYYEKGDYFDGDVLFERVYENFSKKMSAENPVMRVVSVLSGDGLINDPSFGQYERNCVMQYLYDLIPDLPLELSNSCSRDEKELLALVGDLNGVTEAGVLYVLRKMHIIDF